jgi:hypothetical protein
MDSGRSNLMTSNLEAFTSLDKSMTNKVNMSNGTIRATHDKGNVKLNSCGMGSIFNVLYALHLDTNLLSLEQFLEECYSLVFFLRFIMLCV